MMTDRKINITIINGFGAFTPIGMRGAEHVWIKLSEIVSMLAFEESTLIRMSDGSFQNVSESIISIFSAME